ncbi:MAG TPA: helix-turn-helix domain-containing protein [Candidatus Thermoplasmatota archaeon]|nr:helix-turn-helix domain-containing protein [Candidatus Thermoplasmatota archaeon]
MVGRGSLGLSLTEMVFEVADPRHPLCKLTAEDPAARGVYRVLDSDSDVVHSTLTVLGPNEPSVRLAKELRDGGAYEHVEILSVAPYAVVMKLARRVTPSDTTPEPPAPLERLLEVFGSDTIFEPFFADHGRVRIRAVLAEPVDTKRALVKLQELQRAIRWQEFRVIRVAEFKATRYAESLRRVLEPEQEDILRLAVRLGYYESPKRCTLQDIAKDVGLSVSPVHKKLKNVEQLLVTAHVDPAASRSTEARRRARPAQIPTEIVAGALAEVTLRVVWPSLVFTEFSQRHPNSLVLLQPLSEDPAAGRGSALLILVAAAADYRGFIEDLRKRPEIERMDFISRDTDHVSLRVRWRSPTEAGLGAQPFPFLRPLGRLGRDVHVKPLMVEGGEAQLKAILTHPTSTQELQTRLQELAKEASWKAWEMLSLRPVDADPALAASPADRMTIRQAEILKIAHALGYYRTPRGCTLDEVARTLGISANAIHKNLTAAEQKIVTAYLSGSLWQA